MVLTRRAALGRDSRPSLVSEDRGQPHSARVMWLRQEKPLAQLCRALASGLDLALHRLPGLRKPRPLRPY